MASPMRVLSLCTGIGGIDLAAEATGQMEIVGQVEIDEFCNRVLAHHWPHVQRARDLYEVTGDEWGAIDLVVAGFPCQPASLAGKRRGQADVRWLWPEVCRIIRSARPAWCLLENVPGLISLGLDDVLGDLESAGYEATACVYPAAAVGAPHQRERIFIVGHLANTDSEWRSQPQRRFGEQRRWTINGSEAMADANQYGGRWAQRTDAGRVAGACGTDVPHEGHTQRATAQCGRTDVADAARTRLAHRQQTGQPTDGAQSGARVESEPQRCGSVEYASGTGCEERDPSRVACDAGHAAGRSTTSKHRGQVESRLGVATHGLPGRLAGHPASSILSHRWPARPGEAQYEWEAPRTVPASDRTPRRAAKLKALGNAVVPQQVYPILAAIAETWRQIQEVA